MWMRFTRPGCVFEKNPHMACAEIIDCPERHYSTYSECPQCVTGDDWLSYPRGRCVCETVACTRIGEKSHDEGVCKDLIKCGAKETPICSFKSNGDSKGFDDGFCACGWAAG